MNSTATPSQGQDSAPIHADDESMQTLTLHIEGMSCASCVRRLEKALGKVAGVGQAEVSLALNTAEVHGTDLSETDLVQAVEKAGFKGRIELVDAAQGADEPNIEVAGIGQWLNRLDRWAVWLSMLLTLPLVFPMLVGHHAVMPSPLWQCLLATVVQFVLGWRFYKAGYHALRSGGANMDVLIALGTTAAYGLSIYLWWVKGQSHDLYFESSAVVITLVLLGKWLESRARYQTSQALRALQQLRPETARVLKPTSTGHEKEQNIPINQVRKGDTVVIRPGERIPVDARILDGQSHIDESMMTGESLPVYRQTGDAVLTGAINKDGFLKVKVIATGGDTALSKMIALVTSAQARKAPIQKMVDRVSAVFVPVVLAIAALTWLFWGFTSSDWTASTLTAVSVLVIA